MAFNSFAYLIFLPVVYLGFLAAPRSLRWLWLLLASLAFYGALEAPHLLAALGGVALASYLAGLGIHGAKTPGRRRLWFWAGLLANLGVLLWLRYLPALAALLGRPVAPLLAVGVSYYVFQAISYLVDLYTEVLEEPERHPGYFALYLAFFPKLLQGPIERGDALLPQLRAPFRFDGAELRLGLHLFFWGLFKKVVIADRLAPFVTAVYGEVHGYSGLPLILATYLFALQLFFDFSGYTDMALGTARLYGVRLTQNFQEPYLATSVTDFWRRWHLSFSRWILSYLFQPMQVTLRRWRRWGNPIAIAFAFLLSGLWHGPTLCFIVWGALHGLYLGVGILLQPWKKRLEARLQGGKRRVLEVWRVIVTFHLVSLAWVFFRAERVSDAWHVVRSGLLDLPRSVLELLGGQRAASHELLFGQPARDLITALALVGVALVIGALERRAAPDRTRIGELPWLARLAWPARVVLYAVGVYGGFFFGAKASAFIYTQF